MEHHTDTQFSRLGEILVDKGVATPDQLVIALTEQQKTGELLGKILVRLGFATEAIIWDVMGGAIGQESINLEHVIPDSEATALISEEMARRMQVLPIKYDSKINKLTVAVNDTVDLMLMDQLTAKIGKGIGIFPLLASETEIAKAIDKFYGFELSVDAILREIETGEVDYQSLDIESEEYNQPVVRLVNAVLSDAVKRGASDIHFEPEEGFLRFRYRIDGVLRQIRSIHKSYWSAIAVRLKVMTNMDIAEVRAPQDGRISMSFSGRPVDFRASTLPTIHGENIVFRVLDRHKGIVNMEQLGLQEDTLDTLRVMIAKPEGIILVTGPTGSGKTTTLYSIVNYLNDEAVNIMTLEDPVEYPTHLIRQTSINETARLDFASGIRSLMRQDPDIILIGEIRDVDTANMALRAAMTGHQVFSTLHTNSALGAIPRLLDIGIRPEILAGNLIGIMGQRLIRKLCKKCKQSYSFSKAELDLICLHSEIDIPTVYRCAGCPGCENQGYQGRTALMEILHLDSDLDELIVRNGTQGELMEMALSKGFKTLANIGTANILNGLSSFDEVSRVIDLTQRSYKRNKS